MLLRDGKVKMLVKGMICFDGLYIPLPPPSGVNTMNQTLKKCHHCQSATIVKNTTAVIQTTAVINLPPRILFE